MAWTSWFAENTAGRSRQRHRLIEELTRSVALVTDPQALYDLIVDRFRELARSESAIFCVYQEAAGEFREAAHSGGPLQRPQAVWSASGRLAKWLKVNEECLALSDAREVLAFLDDHERQLLLQLCVRVCVPLLSESGLVGILVLISTDKGWRLDAGDRAFLGECGRQAALLCEGVGRHRSEQDRFHAMHRAQQLAVAGQLAATVAHEVRNPLTAIRSSLQFVLDSKSGLEHGREILQRLLAEVDRIEDTLSGVLSLSRSHALNASDLELTDVINQSAQLVRPYAEASGVEIHVEPCPTTLPIRGDQRQLRQVFLNLLMNACQAMTGGAVRLRADVLTPSDNQDGATPMAIVHVIDTGSGMSPDQLTRVFDPFFTTKEAGTGLGLPVCLEIVTRHAGRLEITSDLGTGTTATVILPLR